MCESSEQRSRAKMGSGNEMGSLQQVTNIPKGLEAHFSAGSYIRALALCGTTDLV